MTEIRKTTLVLIGLLLTACTEQPIKQIPAFQWAGRSYLYSKDIWSLYGKLSASNGENSVSASFDWTHNRDRDIVELSGVLGQGRVRLEIVGNTLEIKQGLKRDHFVGNVDNYLSTYIGIFIPISMLKYWLRGLPSPGTSFDLVEGGFIQAGWHIRYFQMKRFSGDNLPTQIRIESKKALLKIFVKLWRKSTNQ